MGLNVVLPSLDAFDCELHYTEAKTHALAFDTGVLGDYFGSVRVFLRFQFKHQF